LGSVVADVVSVTLPGGQDDEKVTVTGCAGGDPAESVTVTAIDALPYADSPPGGADTVKDDIFKALLPVDDTEKFVDAVAL
jgi:hypothetical protein